MNIETGNLGVQSGWMSVDGAGLARSDGHKRDSGDKN